MCLAYPARVLSIVDGTAAVELRGRVQAVVLLGLERPPAPGDWLLVQSGIALAHLDPEEAAERARLLAQLTEVTP